MANEQPPDLPERSLAERVTGRVRRELEALEPVVAEARADRRAQQARRAITRARLTVDRVVHGPDEQLERIARRAIVTARRDAGNVTARRDAGNVTARRDAGNVTARREP